jgi:hypothetical protein
MLLHFVNGITPALASGRCADLANALKPIFATNEGFDRLEFAAASSNVFNDIPFTPIAGTHTGSGDPLLSAVMCSFVGRTPEGTRIRLYVFTTMLAPDSNYRITSAEGPLVAATLAVLRSQTNPIVAVDGGTPVWKDYMNIGVSKYWMTRRRRA